MKPGLWLLVRADLRRRPAGSLLIVLFVAGWSALNLGLHAVDHSVAESIRRGEARVGADLVALPRGLSQDLADAWVDGRPVTFYMDAGIERRIAVLPFVEQTSPQLFIRSLTGATCCSSWNTLLIGFDPRTDFTVRPWLGEGRPPEGDQVLAGPALGLKTGDTVRFFGHHFQVSGVMEPTGMGLDLAVFVPLPAARKMIAESGKKAAAPQDILPDRISAVTIRLKPEGQGGLPAYRARFEIEQAIPEVSLFAPGAVAEKISRSYRNALSSSLFHLSEFLVPANALLVLSVFMLAVSGRRREIGLLRGMGASRGFVSGLFISESLLLCLGGAVAGLSAATLLLYLFGPLYSQRHSLPWLAPEVGWVAKQWLALVLLSAVTGLSGALIPATRAAGMEPYEAIRGGEA